MFYVYVLKSISGADGFYVGYSGDLRRRLAQHNEDKVHSTRGRSWRLVYYEAYATWTAAMDRERVLKGDGRTRRALMDRIKKMLAEEMVRGSEPFDGGERQTGE